jgi:hypothetical protein
LKDLKECKCEKLVRRGFVVGLAYYQGKKDIVFRFIIEYYSSLRDFGPYSVIIIIGLFIFI